MKQKVGFMGMGIMGTAMASNILKAGYPLMVYNRTPDKAEPLVRLGADLAPSPQDLARAAAVVITMVTGPEALENLIFGPDGAGAALSSGKVLINMSSVSPEFTRSLAERLSSMGGTFLEAPVSGTKQPAEQGTLIILAGGPEDKVKEMEPLLLTMGKKVVYCGPVGQGSMMKMFINLLLGLMMAGFAEALNFGRTGGLDPEKMLDVVFSGPLNSGLYQMKAPLMLRKDFAPAFPLKHMTKDAKFIVDTAYDQGAPVPLGQMLLHLYRIGWAQGWGDEDISAVARVMEHLSGK